MEYNRNFSMIDAYNFLAQHGLSQECAEIKNSPDTFKKYTTTLRRGKIIVLLRDKNLIEEFCNTVWQSGLTEKGKTRIRFFENLVERLNADQNGTISEDEVDDEEDILLQTEENQFAYENDLRNYLVKNLSIIEKGLKLYEAPDKRTGEEYCIPGTSRRIDILAVDKDDNFVVIELKVNRGHEKVVGQTLYYQSMIRTLFNKPTIRAIIIAREISAELNAATKYQPDIELFEYQLSLTLNKIK